MLSRNIILSMLMIILIFSISVYYIPTKQPIKPGILITKFKNKKLAYPILLEYLQSNLIPKLQFYLLWIALLFIWLKPLKY